MEPEDVEPDDVEPDDMEFIMSGCFFIIFVQPVSFIMASWLMAAQAFIRVMSALDTLGFAVMLPVLELLAGGALYWAYAAPALSARADPAMAANCRSFI